MPGFCDMHVHLSQEKSDLFLYLANGITTIRNMAGIQFPALLRLLPGLSFFRHLNLKTEISNGKLTGPDIFNGTRLLDGNPRIFPWPISKKITSVQKVPKLIRKYKSRGYDFIKVYSNLRADVFETIIKQSSKEGMPVGGHVPYAVDLEKAINTGIEFIEHLFGYINTVKPDKNEVAAEDMGRMVGLTVEKGVWNCPTLIAWKRYKNLLCFREFKKLEYLKYLSPLTFGGFIRNSRIHEKKNARVLKKIPNYDYQIIRGYQRLAPLVKMLFDSGALMMTGSDANNPFVVPGYSLHDEFQLLAEAGIPNNDILKMSTCEDAGQG